MVKLNKLPSHTGEPKKIRSVKKSTRVVSATAVLLTTALLSGCASYSTNHMKVGDGPDDYRTSHPIIVSENEQAADIIVHTHAKTLSQRDRDLVVALAYKFKRSGSRTLAVLVPTNSNNSSAAASLAKAAIMQLKTEGIRRNQIALKHYDASQHGGSATLRLVYTDLTAGVASKCGTWGDDLMDTSANKNYGNFGCATQSNLANSIAHPSDLLGPRGTSEIDASRRTTVIDNWRETGAGDNKSYN
ncbi:MAG: CpaD family pilus assembly protein [Nitratireductor sp.]